MMKAAIKALDCGKEWYAQVNDAYAKRRRIAEKIMDQLHCTFDPQQSGLFLWGRIPDNIESSEVLADKLLYEAHVFLTPGFIFGSNGNRFIRISLCATEQKMVEALKRIEINKNLDI